jgi:hypothetical protein
VRQVRWAAPGRRVRSAHGPRDEVARGP